MTAIGNNAHHNADGPMVASVDEPVTEICLRPEQWSYEERPVATQSSPDGGLVLTHYRDARTVRVHSLQWGFATAAERETVLQMIPARAGAISARFAWKTPHGERVLVTVTEPPRVSRTSHGVGSISLQLEEQLTQQLKSLPIAGQLFMPAYFYTSPLVA